MLKIKMQSAKSVYAYIYILSRLIMDKKKISSYDTVCVAIMWDV